MNKVCREYISEIKALFPIKRKPERDYINKLASDIADYSEEANVTTKQELYENYGKPNDVVKSYLSTVDTEYIVKQIKVTRYIKAFIIAMLVLATIATSALCITLNAELRFIKDQEKYATTETIITEHN